MVRAGLALLLVAPIAVGQAPPAAPAAQPQPQQQPMNPVLWQHLQAWEKVMGGASNFVSEKGSKTEFEQAKNFTKTFEATIWCLKPNLARMRLDRLPLANQKPDPSDFETYICDGKAVFQYEGLTRTVTQYPLGPGGGVGDNLLLEFMSGSITARQAAQRFSIEWDKPNDPTYLYLILTPLLDKDKAEFETLTLVLVRPGLPGVAGAQAYLPRVARLVKPKAQVIETWDFPNPMVNAVGPNGAPIGAGQFQFVQPGQGWKVVNAAAKPPAPRR